MFKNVWENSIMLDKIFLLQMLLFLIQIYQLQNNSEYILFYFLLEQYTTRSTLCARMQIELTFATKNKK